MITKFRKGEESTQDGTHIMGFMSCTLINEIMGSEDGSFSLNI